MTRGFWRAAPIFLLVASLGCAHIPYFKRWAKKPYYPYLKHKMFSFEYPRKWGDPVATEYGVEMRHPDGLGLFSIEYIPNEAKAYKPPDKYRRDMTVWGSVEDTHVLTRIQFSSRTAYNVRFTSYEYDARYLLGEQVKVQMTDHTMVVDPRGLFVLTFRTPRDEFWNRKMRKEHRHWLGSLVLAAPPEDDKKKP
jgi:hypothetical protein